ncbi:thiamine pyrophosphate-binding protein [Saccharopolyspora spinosa]|uniref:Acetolactate synthase-1/2/3 large subunit n=1 Tax=Saccharopolyspora spinosa TaxID=60894 RepID=A0A2N3Y1C6_SACSN|nr:thiamine pyrophosphate-binding protein [Saccharopolyspora spinosa]PKW16744.1 acetolactate synthase-1/2/3 large subunit [Saccharopolyspora spinosa]
MITVADEIARRLSEHGISQVFGYPGETSLSLYAAFQRHDGLSHVVARCPRGAAYAAEAHARITGRAAVCDAPGGIGSPYCTPALLEAYNSGTPLVLLTSGPSKSVPRPWATGQVEHSRLFESIAKRVHVIREQKGALGAIDAALAEAERPRKGPVVVEVAPDVLEAQAEPAVLNEPVALDDSTESADRGVAARRTEQAGIAANAIKRASSVALIAGGGCHSFGATEALREFVSRFRIPVFTTLNGKGALSEVGDEVPRVVGSKGDSPANAYISGCDVVLYVGSKMGDKSTNQYSWPSPDQFLVRIDNDPRVEGSSSERGCVLREDLGSGLRLLSDQLGDWSYSGGTPSAADGSWSRSGTASIVETINALKTGRDVCVGEASVASGWFGALLRLEPPQRLITPRGTGSLGYALPAAVGAAVARPDSAVWTLVGDGGLAMSTGELETIARLGLNLKITILDNGRLNLIDQHAIHHHGAAAVSRDFIGIDWSMICGAIGLPVMRSDSPERDVAEIAEFFAGNGPAVLVLNTSVDEISPDMAIAIRKEA